MRGVPRLSLCRHLEYRLWVAVHLDSGTFWRRFQLPFEGRLRLFLLEDELSNRRVGGNRDNCDVGIPPRPVVSRVPGDVLLPLRHPLPPHPPPHPPPPAG